FGERVGLLADGSGLRSPRSRERIGALRLDADHLGRAAQRGPDDRAAAGAAAAANRDEDRVHVWLVLEDLERVGADAGDEQRLVRRVDVAETSLRVDALDVLARFVEIAAEFDELGAVRAHGGVLFRVVPARHDDGARHALARAGQRDRLAVVA